MELRIALRALSTLPRPRPCPDPAGLAFHDLSIVHGIGSLPVTFGQTSGVIPRLASTSS